MNTHNHGRVAQLDAALAEAMASAVDTIGRRAGQIVMAARLATAVHMSRTAESVPVANGSATSDVASSEAASPPGAARLARRGESA